jgi:allantoinase
VHVNEPGRTEWEGFETATRAAAAGGITTLIDMPLNSIPVTTSLSALEAKRQASHGKLWIDVGFWGGIVPGNSHELGPMIDAGACGFKAFMCHSGIDDFPMSGPDDLRSAMKILAARKIPLLVHAELETPGFVAPPGDPTAYATYLASRPAQFEEDAIRTVIGLCRETGCAVHIVHLAAASALPLIAEAKREGLPISVETCPHYLVFTAEEVPDGATEYKCAPPIREKANREALWEGLSSGVIDFVACDHSPCTPNLKLKEEGDFIAAWGGIAGVQFSLSVVWTTARARGFSLERVVDLVCARTARFAGLADRKGAIAPGRDADLVVWDPEATFTVEPAIVQNRHTLTPYNGLALVGRTEAAYVRGHQVYERGSFLGGPQGRLLARTPIVDPS